MLLKMNFRQVKMESIELKYVKMDFKDFRLFSFRSSTLLSSVNSLLKTCWGEVLYENESDRFERFEIILTMVYISEY